MKYKNIHKEREKNRLELKMKLDTIFYVTLIKNYRIKIFKSAFYIVLVKVSKNMT